MFRGRMTHVADPKDLFNMCHHCRGAQRHWLSRPLEGLPRALHEALEVPAIELILSQKELAYTGQLLPAQGQYGPITVCRILEGILKCTLLGDTDSVYRTLMLDHPLWFTLHSTCSLATLTLSSLHPSTGFKPRKEPSNLCATHTA